MIDLDLTGIGVAVAVSLIAWLGHLAVVYRVTSTGYVYRSKGRWRETEIRPADREPPDERR